MSNWQEHYKRRTVTAEEAVKAVKSGDTVAISIPPQPTQLMDALAARREELRNARIITHTPSHDPGWLQPCWNESFPVTVMMYLGELARPSYDQKLIDYWPMVFSHEFKTFDEQRNGTDRIDVFMTFMSTPDDKGFCSFGGSLWDRRQYCQRARTVIAQVDPGLIRTYGTNYIHVSEIDYFVPEPLPRLSVEEAQKLIDQVKDPACRAELTRIAALVTDVQRAQAIPRLCSNSLEQIKDYARYAGVADPPQEARRIAGYLAELIKDGDTLQIGIGTPSGYMPALGILDGRKDLGWHSEMGARGIVKLIEKGVISGSRKTLNKGKAVFSALDGCSPQEVKYVHQNPLIELRDADYVVNIPVVAAHDNMVTINNAISVDLSGQINSETVFGARLWNGTGGQPELHMGAVLSRGGRAITLLRSTAMKGAVSRIVAQHEEGAAITIPRTFADIIITEYGVARLLGKSLRERAKELINIVHPDFRSDLKRSADKLLYP